MSRVKEYIYEIMERTGLDFDEVVHGVSFDQDAVNYDDLYDDPIQIDAPSDVFGGEDFDEDNLPF